MGKFCLLALALGFSDFKPKTHGKSLTIELQYSNIKDAVVCWKLESLPIAKTFFRNEESQRRERGFVTICAFRIAVPCILESKGLRTASMNVQMKRLNFQLDADLIYNYKIFGKAGTRTEAS